MERWVKQTVWTLVLLHCSAWPCAAQRIFMDTDGDGVHSVGDRLRAVGETRIDIWLETDRNRDGSPATSAVRGGISPSIFSYEFILRVAGGTVDWGPFTSNLPSMRDAWPTLRSPSHFYTGYCGLTVLPPGKYKLGTLVVAPKSGRPSLEFTSSAPGWPGAQTSFGSLNPGKDRNYTLRFTENRQMLENACEDIPGDWADADGAGVSGVAAAEAAPDTPGNGPVFRVRATPNPGSAGASVAVTTTRPGYLRIRLYGPDGRLVRTLRDEASTPAGTHAVRLDGGASRDRSLAAGVYFYAVDTPEGTATGRIVVAR